MGANRGRHCSDWTDERVETLKTLWVKGLSCSQIANELGYVTRNAVIGKASRLHLEPRKDRHNAYRSTKKKLVRNLIGNSVFSFERATEPVEFTPVVIDLPPLNIGLLDLAHGQCRYPVTTDLPFLFCGHAQQKDSSYCGHHHAATHQKVLALSDEERARRSAQAKNNNSMRMVYS